MELYRDVGICVVFEDKEGRYISKEEVVKLIQELSEVAEKHGLGLESYCTDKEFDKNFVIAQKVRDFAMLLRNDGLMKI